MITQREPTATSAAARTSGPFIVSSAPFFQRRVHADGTAGRSGSIGIRNIGLKYGGPTEILPSSSASRNSGYSVPTRISAGRDHQQHVVEQQEGLARHDRRSRRWCGAPARARRRAPAIRRSDAEERQDEQAAARDRMRTNAPTPARRSAPGRCRAGSARTPTIDEQQRPALEQAALVGDGQRVDQRRADQPGHERGVLDRVPEPPAAPAEFVVGPPAAERDAERQERPRRSSSTAASSAPTSRRGVLRASPRRRTRTRRPSPT